MERSLALDVAYLGVAEPGDGVAGTEFTQCVDVDTVTFNFSDAKELSFTSMGHEDPWAVVSRKGDPSSIEFTIPSPTSDEMKMFCGGTVSGDKWEAPNSVETINKAFCIATQPYEGKYVEYTIVNGAVSAKISQAPGSEQTDLLLVKVTRQSAIAADGSLKPSFIREVKTVNPQA